MSYYESLQKFNNLGKLGIQLGLERIEHLMEQLDHPEKKLKFIHVAGTNGKGSTSSMISNALINAGYKTGLFTSPYVLDFRESIQINGQMIREEEFCEVFEYVSHIAEQTALHNDPPTQFEVLTAVALEYYKRQSCDIVVMEVGLGGRLDSTNVIPPPLVQVITSISLDHIGILGDSIEKIAYEKSGIIKGSVTVIYPLTDLRAETTIAEFCKKSGSRLIKPPVNSLEVMEDRLESSKFLYEGIEFEKSLIGSHQIYNAITAIGVCKELSALGFPISTEDIRHSVKHTTLPARTELLSPDPFVLLDGSHNPEGISALATCLEQMKEKNIVFLMGVLADKNYGEILEILSRYGKEFIAVSPDNPRSLSARELQDYAKLYFPNTMYYEDLQEAVDCALKKCNGDSALIVCGSLYLSYEIRPILLNKLNKS